MSEEKLRQLEQRVNNLKAEKIRAEEQLKHLRQKKDEILVELKELGVDPRNLPTAIRTLEAEIATELETIEKQIPDSIE